MVRQDGVPGALCLPSLGWLCYFLSFSLNWPDDFLRSIFWEDGSEMVPSYEYLTPPLILWSASKHSLGAPTVCRNHWLLGHCRDPSPGGFYFAPNWLFFVVAPLVKVNVWPMFDQKTRKAWCAITKAQLRSTYHTIPIYKMANGFANFFFFKKCYHTQDMKSKKNKKWFGCHFRYRAY